MQQFSRSYDAGYTISGQLKTLALAANGNKTSSVFPKWYKDVIPSYSKRVLSQPTDKLPAVSAIAKLIHQTTGAT